MSWPVGPSTDSSQRVTLPLPPGLPLWNVARQRPQFFCARQRKHLPYPSERGEEAEGRQRCWMFIALTLALSRGEGTEHFPSRGAF